MAESEFSRESARAIHDACGPHGLYSCPSWTLALEAGGRRATRVLTGPAGGQFLPWHHEATSRNPMYSTAHLTRHLSTACRSWSVCGSLSGYQLDLLQREGVGSEAVPVLEEAAAAAHSLGSGLLVPYLTAESSKSLPAALRTRLLLENFEAWFEPDAMTVPEYVAGLRSRRRRNWRKDANAFEASGLRAEVLMLSEFVDEFVELVAHTDRKYGHTPDDAALSEHLRAIADVFGADALLLACRNELRLGGAVLAIRHGDELFLRMSGFDPAMTDGAAAYFKLAYHLPLEARSEISWTRVHHGIGMVALKHRHGATLRPLWTYVVDSRAGEWDAREVSALRFDDLVRDQPVDVRDACQVAMAKSDPRV